MKIKSSKNWIIATLLLAVLLCAVASYVNRPLPAYIDQPSEQEEISEVELPWNLIVYEGENYSFQYPSEWTETVKNGNLTFFNNDGSYLMFQQSTYQPQINSVTADSIQNEVAAAGMQPLSYERLSNCSFLFSYQNNGATTWEYVCWDRELECRVILSYPAKDNGDEYQTLVMEVLSSFQWERQAPVSEKLYLTYNAFGNFEFAVPAGWTTSISNGSFYAANTETGSRYCVTVSQTELTTLTEISQIQYVQNTAQTRSNLYIKSFGASSSQITAESIYSHQGEQMLLYHFISLENGYLYELLLDTPISKGKEDYQLFEECIKYFRVFRSEKNK